MSALAERIRDEIRHLPLGERIRLVRDLESDLDQDELNSPKELEDAWDAEEKSRVDEILDGKVKLMSYDDLNRRLDEVRAKHTA